MDLEKGIRHALTIEQQRAFLDYVADSPVYCHWLPIFVVLFGTGCRIGEVIGLRWEDLDYENRLISINHAAIYMFMENRKSEFHISTPKREAGIRQIPMMDAVYKAFKDEYEAQKEAHNAEEILKAKRERRHPVLIPHFSCTIYGTHFVRAFVRMNPILR